MFTGRERIDELHIPSVLVRRVWTVSVTAVCIGSGLLALGSYAELLSSGWLVDEFSVWAVLTGGVLTVVGALGSRRVRRRVPGYRTSAIMRQTDGGGLPLMPSAAGGIGAMLLTLSLLPLLSAATDLVPARALGPRPAVASSLTESDDSCRVKCSPRVQVTFIDGRGRLVHAELAAPSGPFAGDGNWAGRPVVYDRVHPSHAMWQHDYATRRGTWQLLLLSVLVGVPGLGTPVLLMWTASMRRRRRRLPEGVPPATLRARRTGRDVIWVVAYSNERRPRRYADSPLTRTVLRATVDQSGVATPVGSLERNLLGLPPASTSGDTPVGAH